MRVSQIVLWQLGVLVGAGALACSSGDRALAVAPSAAREAVAEQDDRPAEESADASGEAYVRAQFDKREVMIPMRDGVKLFTAIYTPKVESKARPILLVRTPYGVHPYGEEAYREPLGPSARIMKDGYIFVYQDVRGCYMSEGDFVNMRPHIANKASSKDVDESTDTYDTIDWLVKNVPANNHRVGQWGISYPGFYAAAGMIEAHPALVAVSPQAPIADWYFDDFHHHGAFFLPHAFNFVAVFGQKREGPTTERGGRFEHGTPDGYQFFKDLGPLGNVNERYFKGEIPFWNAIVEHPNYDDFWQSRNLLPHLHDVAPAVMTVGGWYDAEDLYGSLNIYQTIERNDQDAFNVLVMGPWRHGGWGRTDGDSLGDARFEARTSLYYREAMERRFFAHFLKGEGEHGLPEAFVFETGGNRWRRFAKWPPQAAEPKKIFAHADERLVFDEAPTLRTGFDEWVSDPNRPVPFTEAVATRMTAEYMTDDQRFAARRPDVVVFQTEPLAEDVTLAGPVLADLWVSTSGTASDWVVKLVDVFPADAEDQQGLALGKHMGGYQMMVRSEVIRGRFRNSYEKPEPFRRNRPTRVALPLQDVLHTFRTGHRIMIQIQSTWFPLVDINPHHYVENVFLARKEDFVKATQRVYRSKEHPTHLSVQVLPAAALAAAQDPNDPALRQRPTSR